MMEEDILQEEKKNHTNKGRKEDHGTSTSKQTWKLHYDNKVYQTFEKPIIEVEEVVKRGPFWYSKQSFTVLTKGRGNL